MRLLAVFALLLLSCAAPRDPGGPLVSPARATGPVSDDPDDPAIWVNSDDPAGSLILGTNKVKAPSGALYVFGIDGSTRQVISGLDRPNNVDVEYGFSYQGGAVDIAVVTERLQHRLLVYRIPEGGGDLVEIGSVPVFSGETGDASEPMGVGLYKRPGDGAVFAILGRKTGPASGYLWQYLLQDDASGGIRGTKVREFGTFSGTGEIEAIAVDDEPGFVYYADESAGIRKWAADPLSPDAAAELSVFGTQGFQADREGIAVYQTGPDTGYIICTDQLPGGSRYLLFRREGSAGDPHDHGEPVKIIQSPADSTDGIEATSTPIGPDFPLGILVAMNSGGKNFLIFDWRSVLEH